MLVCAKSKAPKPQLPLESGVGYGGDRSSHEMGWHHCAARGKLGLGLGALHSYHGSPVQQRYFMRRFCFYLASTSWDSEPKGEPSGVKQLFYIIVSTSLQTNPVLFCAFLKGEDPEDVSATSSLQRKVLRCCGQKDPKGGPYRPVTIGSLGYYSYKWGADDTSHFGLRLYYLRLWSYQTLWA